MKINLEINPASCQLLKWSNDGKRLFFQASRTLKTIELDSGKINDVEIPVADAVGPRRGPTGDQAASSAQWGASAQPRQRRTQLFLGQLRVGRAAHPNEAAQAARPNPRRW